MNFLSKFKAYLTLILATSALQIGCGDSACESTKVHDQVTFETPRYIAHALGAFEGQHYLNCVECFETNYSKGFRYFEMDFVMSSDGRLAGMHDGLESWYSIPVGFEYSQFAASKPEGFTPVTEEKLVELLKAKTDWFLISDMKTGNLSGLNRLCKFFSASEINCKTRVIPQIYSPAEFVEVQALGFDRIILTLYRFGDDLQAIETFLQSNKVYALTIPKAWWSPNWKTLAETHGVHTFVHTIDSETDADQVLSSGASGIYTNVFFR